MEHGAVTAPSTADPAVPPLTFEIEIQASDLQQHWKRCNMVANYIAEYVSYQFTEREWAENLISTVTNEFLEAVSSLSPAETSLIVRCRHRESELLIEIEHDLQPEMAQPYELLLAELAGDVSDEAYLNRLTANRPLVGFNQLGLTMVAHDFGVQIVGNLNNARDHAAIQVIVPIRTPHV